MPGIRVSGLTDLELGSGAGEGGRAAGEVRGGLEKGVVFPDSSSPGLEKGLFPPLLLGAHVQNF